jgi:subtilisin family serine protease
MTEYSTSREPSPFPREVAAGGVVLTLTPDQVYVEFSDTARRRDIAAVLSRYRLEPVPHAPSIDRPQEPGDDLPRQLWLRSVTGDDLASVVGALRATDHVRSASPVYHRADLRPALTGHGFSDDLLVRFSPRANDEEVRALIAARGTAVVGVFPDEREGTLYHLRLGASAQNMFTVVDEFARSPVVRYAGPNWNQLQSPSSATTPNDAHFPQQWNLSRIGAPEGWDISQGSGNVVIAIVDSGCDLGHPDLVNKYVPTADRRDVINNTNTPDDLNPGGGHGTLCAGVAAAETNNTNGVAGVAPNCRIMPIRLWDGRPTKPAMTEVQIVAAIDWARTHRANVISMSWYFTGLTPNADVALDNAHAAGLVLVAASGNCRQNEGCSDASTVVWPATHRRVIAVGATDKNDTRKQRIAGESDPWDSRFGRELSVMAPSPIPWTTANGGGYGDFYGTSAAAPHVAGLAGLLVALLQKPVNIPPWFQTNDLVWNIIEQTAAKVGGYGYATTTGHPNGTWHEEMGYGRIDAAAALRYARDNYTTYKLERPSSAYAVSVQILLGLIGGGAGVVLPHGGGPVPVDPGWDVLAPEKRDVLLGLAVTQLAEGVDDPETRQALARAGWEAIERAAGRIGRE